MNLLTSLYLLAVSEITPSGLPSVDADNGTISDVLTVFFNIIGALAVLMIVVSGLRYVLAGSDSQRAAQAKNGIVYSLVGLAVAISAQAIVYFVVSRL